MTQDSHNMNRIAIFVLALVVPCLGRAMNRHFGREVFRSGKAPYIIGGQDADPAEYPFQAFMEVFGSFGCGATIISDQWILTAAHCATFYNGNPTTVTVGVGYTDRTSDEGQRYDVDEIRCNDDFIWNPATGDDTCVMRLTNALDFSQENVATVTLANEVDDFAGLDDCWIIGWGQTGSGNDLPEILQEAEVTVYTLEECEALYGEAEIDDNEHVCVGLTGDRGACNGDSGGPAFCVVDGTPVQVGIASWVATDIFGCDVDFPSVYSDVGHFRSWINENCDGCIDG